MDSSILCSGASTFLHRMPWQTVPGSHAYCDTSSYTPSCTTNLVPLAVPSQHGSMKAWPWNYPGIGGQISIRL